MDLHLQSMNKVGCPINTDAGPKLINKSFVHQTWAPHVKCQDFLKLRAANEQPIRSDGFLLSHFQIDDLRIHLWFGVVEDIAVYFLMGTSFIDQNLQVVFP